MGAPTRGWLGWFRARYEISPDRVRVTRTWAPALLLLAIPLAAWLMIEGLELLDAHNRAGDGGVSPTSWM